jgi:hypothetical protein
MKLPPFPAAPYKVSDVRGEDTYYFNIGEDVSAQSAGACGTSSQPPNAMAYQVDNGQFCYALSNSKNDATFLGWNFTLYDETRPARGVSMTLLGGSKQFCGGGRSRTFTLSLQCAGSTPIGFLYPDATVFERNTCDYQIELKSIAGCPTQCINNGLLCANNGVCGYDTDAKRSKCFCFSGFTGGDCSASTSSASAALSGEAIILIVVCIVLSMVIGLVVFMFLKLRKLQVDPAAYDQLQGRFNELGMLSG